MTHLGFRIINLTSNRRTNLGEEYGGGGREQRKVTVFRIDFPFPCWPRRLVQAWGHHQNEGMGQMPGGSWSGVKMKLRIAVRKGTLGSCRGWASFLATLGKVLFFSSLGKHVPWDTWKSSPPFLSPFAVEAETWLPEKNEHYCLKSPFQLKDPSGQDVPHPLSHALAVLRQLDRLRWTQALSSIFCLGPSQSKDKLFSCPLESRDSVHSMQAPVSPWKREWGSLMIGDIIYLIFMDPLGAMAQRPMNKNGKFAQCIQGS